MGAIQRVIFGLGLCLVVSMVATPSAQAGFAPEHDTKIFDSHHPPVAPNEP